MSFYHLFVALWYICVACICFVADGGSCALGCVEVFGLRRFVEDKLWTPGTHILKQSDRIF